MLRKAGTLSGGERARVALALMMLQDANLLVFDEPTNHLDVESIEALEDALDDYEGTVLLVSHDRALLTSLTNRIWAIENQRVQDYPGNFAEWEIDSAKLKESEKAASRGRKAAESARVRKAAGGAKSANPPASTEPTSKGGGRAPRLTPERKDLLGGLALVVEFPVLPGWVVRGVEDGTFKKWIGH